MTLAMKTKSLSGHHDKQPVGIDSKSNNYSGTHSGNYSNNSESVRDEKGKQTEHAANSVRNSHLASSMPIFGRDCGRVVILTVADSVKMG